MAASSCALSWVGPMGLNVLGGILAGLVVLLLSWIWANARSKMSAWQFKEIFGWAPDGYALIYAHLELADLDPADPYRYVKPGGRPDGRFSVSQPVAISEVRAADYLVSSLGRFLEVAPKLRSDLDTQADLDLDFISLGGPGSNLKTADCQENATNNLAVFDRDAGRFLRRDAQVLVAPDPDFDYGLILKVHPAQFPHRVWLVCAGLGEWGTSGAAWFLANKWDVIRKQVGERPFALVVRVRPGQDQSAEIVSPILDG